MKSAVLQLTRNPAHKLIDEVNHFDDIFVIEAPQQLLLELDPALSVTQTECVTIPYRNGLYLGLESLMRVQTSDWGKTLPPKFKDILSAIALPLVRDTWKDIDLLAYLTDCPNRLEIDVITDNDEGVLTWSLLNQLRKLLGGATIRLTDIRENRPPRAQLETALLGRWNGWKDSARTVQDGMTKTHRLNKLNADAPTAIIFCGHMNHWGHLQSIYADFLNQGWQAIVVSSRTPLVNELRAQGVPAIRDRITPLAPITRQRYSKLFSTLTIDTTQLARQSNNSELFAQTIRHALWRRAVPQLSRVNSMRETVRRLCREFPNSVFIQASETHQLGNALTQEAHKCGKPTIQMPHGLMDYLGPDLAYYTTADVFVAWGEKMRSGLKNSPFPQDVETRALGSPAFEERLSSVSPVTQYGAPAHVLIAFGRQSRAVLRSQYERSADEVLDAIAAHQNQSFVIKPHPSDTTSFWSDAISARQLSNARVARNEDFYRLLDQSWAVVTQYSTSGAEAICCGRPLFVVDIRDTNENPAMVTDFVDENAVYEVKERGKFPDLLSTVASCAPGSDALAEKRELFARNFLAQGSNSAAERVVALASELLQTPPPRTANINN